MSNGVGRALDELPMTPKWWPTSSARWKSFCPNNLYTSSNPLALYQVVSKLSPYFGCSAAFPANLGCDLQQRNSLWDY